MKKIVGSGLLAKSFSGLGFSAECLILASGVSNSAEQRASEFKREFELVQKQIEDNPLLPVVYFSTCSVYQKVPTAYTRHKLEMEEYVSAHASSFYIYRLPQVVGVVRNLTLISYLVNAVLDREVVTVQKYAKRNLLDINDVVRLSRHLIENKIGVNTVQNLASISSVAVPDILSEISKILGVDARSNVVDLGESYDISVDFIVEQFGKADPVLSEDYWVKVLRGYVPLLSKGIN
ncbi:NAD-dependent epimerase/dehydratase family protein [Pseudomonas palleroniana]